MLLERKFIPERVYSRLAEELQLYYKGDPALLNSKIATVVGTRSPSKYAIDMTKKIVEKLGNRGYIISSGFALGVDSIAHRTAIDLGIKTIAVLSCGLNYNYPKANIDIRNKIDLLLTEYTYDQSPNKWHFIRRNRLLSAICDTLIVTECSIKSGTMITCKYAIEHGIDLWALPSDITREDKSGCNYLISQGAYCIHNLDIFEELI